ncbi:MAG: twin-arginine translocation signal domain-containing protein, partial [Bacteroidaceae bacterium]|nr:twin-arginine translocation signal domain-containing protein [Bacteroidaceae bacterium]
MMNVTRRNFLKTGAAAVAGFTIAPNIILGKSHGHMAPSDLPNIAAVGVGSQGGGDIQNIADPDEKIGRRPNPDRKYGGWVSPNFAGLRPERRMVDQGVQMGDAGKQPIHHANMYALCDVDLDYAGHIMAGYPKAKKYQDFRKMLDDCGKE